MRTIFENVKISGILSVIPEQVFCIEDEMEGGDTPRLQKIKKNMGYAKRRRVKKDTLCSDFLIYGMNHLLDKGLLSKEDIGAIVVASFTPDYFVPQLSHIVHAALGLSEDVFCIDLMEGCVGYIEGMIESMMLAEQMKDKKVVLMTSDICVRQREYEEKFKTPPYGGDAGSITVFEYDSGADTVYSEICSDGSGWDQIIMESAAYADLHHEKAGVKVDNRSFVFFQEKVPEVLRRLLERAGKEVDDIDRFFLIQANMLSARKMAERMKIPFEKVPMNLVERFGDCSASLQALCVTEGLGEELFQKEALCCFGGYGAGFYWGGVLITLKDLRFCKTIISDL